MEFSFIISKPGLVNPPGKGLLKKDLSGSLRAEMIRRQAGHRSAAISKSLPQRKLRSPRLAREARSRLAMTGVWEPRLVNPAGRTPKQENLR